jgi:hypothetical protein
VLAGALALWLALAAASLAATPHKCGDVRMTRFYKAAVHGQFGAIAIKATGTTCATAKKVAGKFTRNPYSVGDKPVASHVDGFACRWKPAHDVAQQVNVSCTDSQAKLTFADTIPSG